MRIVFLTFFIFYFRLSAGETFSVDPFSPGQKVLKLTLFDSLVFDDLAKIEVDGHEIENAVFFQENDINNPTIISDKVVDIPSVPSARVLSFLPEQNTLVVETPVEFILQPGSILSDTSYGGFSQKIIHVTGYENRLRSLIWTLKTVPALLEESVIQCDISFISHPDMTISLPDTQWSAGISGRSSDSLTVKTTLGLSLKNFSINIRPKIAGRLRINKGMVEIFSFQIHGSYDIQATVSSVLAQAGIFDYSAPVSFNITHNITLARGLTLKLAHSAQVKLHMESQEDNFLSGNSVNIRENLQINLTNINKTWYAQASDITLTPLGAQSDINYAPISSPGSLRFSILPHLELLWGGESGIVVTPAVYSTHSNTRNYLGLINQTKLIGRETFAMSVNSEDSNFVKIRNFIPLGAYEQVTGTPPARILSVSPVFIGADTIKLDWPHDPQSDYYLVQVMMEDTVFLIDSLTASPAVLTELEPLTEYTFRIIPVNSMGIGIPGIITCATLKKTHPPEIPFLISPAADTSGIESQVTMAWRSNDIDSGDVLLYTLFLDTLSIPSSLIFTAQPDTSYTFRSIIPGKTYYWKIMVSDGRHLIHGPVWEFSSASTEPPDPEKDLTEKISRTNAILISASSFKRKDGNEIHVSSFYIHKYEVTQGEYEKVKGKNPSFRKGVNLPVENVSWYEAESYCKDINGRLPTEAEWELAARAGTETKFFWGDNDINDHAWYYQNSGNRTHPVGTKEANPWGLYDMSGNVFEWVFDWYGEYSDSELTDPSGAAGGQTKVTRGGSWYSDAASLKSSARFKNRPAFTNYKLGFRCAFSVLDENLPD